MFYEDMFIHSLQGENVQRFRDRADAGRQLAQELTTYANHTDALVLGLARGGVPVAYEIATALHLPLDVLIVRKLGVPGHKELAMGAIASGNVRVLNQEVVEHLAIPNHVIDHVVQMETEELLRRERAYRGNRPFPDISGKTVIVADDGIATGATLLAAIAALRVQSPARIVVAAGVAPPESYNKLVIQVDELICIMQPVQFGGVGLWFELFGSTSDEEVRTLLAKASGQYEMTDPLPV